MSVVHPIGATIYARTLMTSMSVVHLTWKSIHASTVDNVHVCRAYIGESMLAVPLIASMFVVHPNGFQKHGLVHRSWLTSVSPSFGSKSLRFAWSFTVLPFSQSRVYHKAERRLLFKFFAQQACRAMARLDPTSTRHVL